MTATDVENEEILQICVEPLLPGPNAIDITPNQDGGVYKEIKKEGENNDSPLPGDKVSVHYIGTLTNGTVFDSSRERGDYFEFNLGKGSVIKAWDLGVATMKKGELAILHCKPEYAYGSAGSPPKIPPNATLLFEIELFGWKGEDLSNKKDGGIIRRQIQKGEGYSTPNNGAQVEVHLIGRYNNTVFEERDVTFPLGEGSEFDMVEGLEKALEKFKKGEISLIQLKSKYAFGETGNPSLNIPPNADVEYEVTLNNFEKAKESWELEVKEKIEQANFFKTKGTNYFKAGKYNLALKQYKKIIDFVEHITNAEPDEEQERKQLVLAGHLNLAICYLKLGDPLNAEKSCEKVLEMDPNNQKGLFRRGMARMGQNEMESAKADFQAVVNLDPTNKAALTQISICNSKIKEQRETDRRIYANMFTKFAMQDRMKEERLYKQRGDVLENPGTWGEDDLRKRQAGLDALDSDEMRDKFIDSVNLDEVQMLN